MMKWTRILTAFIAFFFAQFIYAQKIAAKHDREIAIELKEGTLYGSFLIPKSKKPIPVVLIIPGSGPTDRDCNSSLGMKSNSFLYLAESLYKEGIATLRVDKRISGKSQATFMSTFDSLYFDAFISDARLWIDTLKKDKRFSEVIVAGHSQGSLVGMMAARESDADRFISIAGAGRSIDDIMVDQYAAALPTLGDTVRMFFDSIRAGVYDRSVPLTIRRSFPENMVIFMQQWMSYEPTGEIAKLNIPVLIINGEHDIQVGAEEAELLHKAYPEGKLVIIPGMSHVLKNAPEERFANMATYNDPDLPINEQLIMEIVRFIRVE